MKKNWWKILGPLLVLYSFGMGLLTPLKTGISDIRPQFISAGDTVKMEVTGYNSFYKAAEGQLRAWLKLDQEHALAAQAIEVKDDRHLVLHFVLPPHLPKEADQADASLLIDSPVDGAHVYPGGIRISQKKTNVPPGSGAAWNAPIEHLHEKDAITFPFRNILGETIRNTYYHVPMWFAMFLLFIGALVHSINFLRRKDLKNDRWAAALTTTGLVFGAMGLATGAMWATYTWGEPWSGDVKQNMTAIGLLIYGAYFVLRFAMEDPERKARISAVYNIFAFSTLIPLLYVIPKLTDSLHPGAGGNIAFGSQDLDNTMRLVFYPAIIGWTLIGLWASQLLFRMNTLREKLLWGH
ncbi:MAG: hypothetical protein Kow0027_14880 [Saprospiraceae bacterium]